MDGSSGKKEKNCEEKIKWMTNAKKELLSKTPCRGEEDDESNKFKEAKLKVTSQAPRHVPRKKSKRFDNEDDALEIDPGLRYGFQRNFQVFSFYTPGV